MEYNLEYLSKYNQYFENFESAIKLQLINGKEQSLKLGVVCNDLKMHYSNTRIDNLEITKNEKLASLFKIYKSNLDNYENDEINLTLKNHIVAEFNILTSSDLPIEYSIKNFISEIADFYASKEIYRLLSINNKILEMFYELNDFTDFELRDYRGLTIENYPIYKKLYLLLNPTINPASSLNKSLSIDDNEIDIKKPSLPFAITLLEEIGFFKLEKLKGLSPQQLAKLIALIQIKSPNDKNLLRSISGNIRMVSGGSDNPSKYTANSDKNINLVRKLFNEIKNGE